MSGSGFRQYWAPFGIASVFFFLFLAPNSHAQLAITPSSVSFGSVPVGSSQTQTVSIANTGNSSLVLSQVGVSGTGYAISGITLPYSLSPGQSVGAVVTFTPPAAGADSGSVSASATITTTSHGFKKQKTSTTVTTATASLSGSGTALTGTIAASPASLSFGSVFPGSSQTLMVTVSDTGTASLTISGASLSSASFTVSGLTLPVTLAAGQSVTFGVVFAPSTSGAVSGNLAITSNASNGQLNIGLSGTGATAGQLTLTPTAMNFGSVTTGSSSSLTGTLSASGSSVTVSSGASTSTEFAVSGISLPITLAPGQSVPFTVTFLPQVSGTASGTLTFASNATNGSVSSTLSGSGTAPVQHSVGLSWSASTSTGVVGYNVYRGSVSGGPYAQVTSADPNVTWTDSTVSGGQTYYYVVTAVDSAGTESAYSNQVQAIVPSP